ncbi:MAG: U3 snoRNP protein [Bathelium mastoideum]|nr:MAG: U3 snoRNP protein [Bathelium mastoideum]KAI9685399.1 MAG: U3 snoRNP protein [Bathelium mastoideum]
MAGASDKARFYLEQSVPELQDLEKKKIFTKEEISSIARKRSDFEHILNARGSKPSDYARYAQFEMNLEALRRKRVKRMGVKSKNYTGSRRIFFVLDRGTRKFQGDLGLWMQYIDFAKKEKSYKKLGQIFSTVLRLHPTKPELWIYAAHYAMDMQADMTMARTYMQRGLRFCKRSKKLWLEYAKLEMIYVAKVAARQQILGLDEPKTSKTPETDLDEPDADQIVLPVITAEDVNPVLANDESVDSIALQKLASSPALTGAIPIAAFDAAMKEFDNDAEMGREFFDMCAEFDQTPPLRNLLLHVMHTLETTRPKSLACASCHFRSPLVGIDPTSAEFPPALAQSLHSLKQSSDECPEIRIDLTKQALLVFCPLTRDQNLDEGVRRALFATIRQYLERLKDASGDGEAVFDMIQRLLEGERLDDARLLTSYAKKWWSTDHRLQELPLAAEPAS